MRLRCEGACKLDAALQPVRKAAGRDLGQLAKAKRIENGRCTRVGGCFLTSRLGQGQQGRPKAVLHAAVLAEQDIFENGQASEEPQVLERSSDAEVADAVTFQPTNFAPKEGDAARARRKDT